MKTSTKILLIINIISIVGATLLFPSILNTISFQPVFKFAFSWSSVFALVFFALWLITVIILFIGALKKLSLTKKLFFITTASTAVFAFLIISLLNMNSNNATSLAMFNRVSTGMGANSTIIYIFIGALCLLYILFLLITFKILTKPIKKLKIMVRDINQDRHYGKYKVGGSRDFVEIAKGLVEIDKKLLDKEKQIKMANAEYEKVVPKQFLKFLGKKSFADLELGTNITKEVTTMFCDIHNSTETSETLTLAENFKFINSYLGVVSPIIRQYNGFIDKYLGDGFLAVFSSAQNAVDCSKEIIRQVNIKNALSKFKVGVEVGIGIHTGEVVFGVVGEQERKSPTIISDNVNYASKMQEVNKIYGTTVILSKRTINSLKNENIYNFRYVGLLKLGGAGRFAMFELLDVLPIEKKRMLSNTKSLFEEGVRYYDDAKYNEASVCFKKILLDYENEKASEVYLSRCETELNKKGKVTKTVKK